MTREFYADLQRTFPEWNQGTRKGFRIQPYNYEQFNISKLNAKDPLNKAQIEELARRELKGLSRRIIVADADEIYQGVGKTDVVIQFNPRGRNVRQLHFIALEQKEFMDGTGYAKALISLSWHGSYGLTPFQHQRYLEFLKEYFARIPFND